MNIYNYVALKNPHGAKDVINSFGKKAIRQPEALAKQLADTVNRHGKEALRRIAAVHPDLELLTAFNENEQSKSKDKPCKCNDKEKSSFSSADGQAIKQAVEEISKKQDLSNNTPKEQPVKTDNTNIMILGAVAILGLALILNK